MKYDGMICEKCMVKHPVEVSGGQIKFNFCPECGSELIGVTDTGINIDTDEEEDNATEEED